MQESRVFQWIGRFNAIAMMLMLIGGLGMLGFLVLRDLLSDPAKVATSNIADDPEGLEKWSLGQAHFLEGTPMLYLPLVSEQASLKAPRASSLGYGSSGSGPARNLLFTNSETGAMVWLLKDNSQLITETRVLAKQGHRAEDGMAVALLHHLVQRDSDGDKRITVKDQTDLALSTPDGQKFAVIQPAVDRVFGTQVTRAGDLYLVFQSAGKAYAATVRLSDFSLLSKREVPRVEEGR